MPNSKSSSKNTPSRLMKRQLLEALQTRVTQIRETRKLSQTEAAKLLGITQPRLSSLVMGHAHLFSIESLSDLASKAGLTVKLTVVRARQAKG